jgi:hypothetical protein
MRNILNINSFKCVKFGRENCTFGVQYFCRVVWQTVISRFPIASFISCVHRTSWFRTSINKVSRSRTFYSYYICPILCEQLDIICQFYYIRLIVYYICLHIKHYLELSIFSPRNHYAAKITEWISNCVINIIRESDYSLPKITKKLK